jgi:ligand-binding SRPBCC domain-containing protein
VSLRRFVRTTEVAASAEALFAWHEEPAAFQRLTPPGEPVTVLRQVGGIRDGAQVSVRVGVWPFALRWDLEHRDYRQGASFTDVQRRGPFRSWRHVHTMTPLGADRCQLEDRIEYELPGGVLGDVVARLIVEPRLRRLFDYRHRVTREAFADR